VLNLAVNSDEEKYSLFCKRVDDKVNRVITITPVANVIKLLELSTAHPLNNNKPE